MYAKYKFTAGSWERRVFVAGRRRRGMQTGRDGATAKVHDPGRQDVYCCV